MLTYAKPPILPPTPDPRRFGDVQRDELNEDYLVEQVRAERVRLGDTGFTNHLWLCLRSAFDDRKFETAFLQMQQSVWSWNAMHLFLGDVVEAAERQIDAPDHSVRVSHITLRIGAALGLQPWELHGLYWGAVLHDIGKLAVDRSILTKPSPLTADEWWFVREHPAWGHKIIGEVLRSDTVAEIAFTHHEHWDGGGYPRGLKGEAIPLNSRIVAVADTFDVLTSGRNYRRAVSAAAAVDVIRREAGHQFDPDLVRRLLDGDVLFQATSQGGLPDLG